jgi:hypothetical protein
LYSIKILSLFLVVQRPGKWDKNGRNDNKDKKSLMTWPGKVCATLFCTKVNMHFTGLQMQHQGTQ